MSKTKKGSNNATTMKKGNSNKNTNVKAKDIVTNNKKDNSKLINLLTLLSAIYITVIMGLIIWLKLDSTTDGAVKVMVPLIIVLAWACRYNMSKGKALWTVYGFVLSIGCIDIIGMVGYWKAIKALKSEK